MASSPRIQILLDQTAIPRTTAEVLRRLGAEIELSTFDRHDRPRSTTPIDARLVITRDGNELRDKRREQLLTCCDANPCGTLVLSMKEMTIENSVDPAIAERGVSFVHNPSGEELAAQLSVLSGMRGPIGTMRRALSELRSRESAHVASLQKFNDEQRMAGLVQREFLNAKLPEMRNSRWLTLYHPAEIVSGDLYEVVRLDRDRVAITLLDATGHGLSAALLAAYGRRAVQAEIGADTNAMDLPHRVLRRMNHEVVSANLSECQFISAIQAVYNENTNELTWARGGACYPILVRENHPPMQVRSSGPLVGVDADAQFETVRLQLEPGDTVLFFTDGLDGLLRDEGAGEYSNDISATDWFAGLSHENLPEQLAAIEERLESLTPQPQVDDVTVIGLHVLGAADLLGEREMNGEYSLAGMYL